MRKPGFDTTILWTMKLPLSHDGHVAPDPGPMVRLWTSNAKTFSIEAR